MWFFILAELTVFGILILAFAVAQAMQPAVFRAGRRLLDTSLGWTLTLSLLTAGLFAALALARTRQGRSGTARLLGAALAAAGGYVVLKFGEYAHLARSGLGLERDTFFTLYWILTGFHFLHVLLGMVILGWMAWRSRQGCYGPAQHAGMESGTLYWHMVDLVWVVLFPLVYLLD
ncbi:cytochrome c oxidase subunit 3 [Bordetella petrii]|uniref:cytochrome c oxidase subunit 3 n=1 Tax=Bordetella petrii TaxID=94624 RepID=UPI001E3B792E|nr:cytochrome c oxidase subunit 3 [Bordetella petrii]MCD0501389.1 cytochrome c oxidase subunit 3 [Bordetella petrii]